MSELLNNSLGREWLLGAVLCEEINVKDLQRCVGVCQIDKEVAACGIVNLKKSISCSKDTSPKYLVRPVVCQAPVRTEK